MKRPERPFFHVGYIFLLAVAIFAAAIGLVYLERCAAAREMPQWLLWGMHCISVGLFTLDGIMVLGASAILVIKLLHSLWSDKE